MSDLPQRVRRSCIAVPGSSEKMLAKARTLSADEIFIDLEDAVASEVKNDTTRERVAATLRETDWVAPTRTVRINGVGTRWCLDDLLTIVGGAGEHLHCVMVPKVSSAAEIQFVAELLSQLEQKYSLGGSIGIEVLVESPRAVVELERIATASPRVEALVFGVGDYAAAAGVPQLSIGVTPPGYPGDVWHYVLAQIVTTAHAYGLQAIDGPFAAIRDLEGLRESAHRSRLLGFDGKLALHPDQIEICNDIYRPTQAEYNRAEQILDALAGAGDGAVAFDGEMIDEASRKMAFAIVERGRNVGMRRSAN